MITSCNHQSSAHQTIHHRQTIIIRPTSDYHHQTTTIFLSYFPLRCAAILPRIVFWQSQGPISCRSENGTLELLHVSWIIAVCKKWNQGLYSTCNVISDAFILRLILANPLGFTRCRYVSFSCWSSNVEPIPSWTCQTIAFGLLRGWDVLSCRHDEWQ